MIRSFCFVALLVAICAHPATCVELITNGGFETGDTSGWTAFSYSATPIPSTVVTPGHAGTYSVTVDASGGKEGGLRQHIATTPGQHVRFSAWVRSNGAGFIFIGYSANGGTNPNQATWVYGWNSPNWTYGQMEFDAVGTTATIWLDAWNGVGWFDEVTTEITGDINGTVTDSVTANPVGGVAVSVMGTGYSTTTDPNGQYAFQSLAAGTYTVQFRDYRYSDFDKPNVAVTGAGPAQADAQMTPRDLGSISGTVRDTADNSPIEGAAVWISGVPGISEDAFRVLTSAAGTYSIPDVPENTYTVRCMKPGFVEQSVSLAVSAGPATPKDWALTWRVVDPVNAVQNGTFESAVLAPWTEWSATHYMAHQDLDEDCQFGDQFVGGQTLVQRSANGGVGGTAAAEIGLAGGQVSAGCGGLRQQAYVEPGKYYRVRAQFKANVAADLSAPNNDFEFALGLVDGRFDPGVYSSPAEPPVYADDVAKMQCHGDWFGTDLVPEPEMPWHNIMASRDKSHSGVLSWDWMSTMDSLSPRNLLVSGVKRATGDVMTVVLYSRVSYDIWNFDPPYSQSTALFDNVVLEEVSGYPDVSLADLRRIDVSPPFHNYPDKYPVMTVNLTGPSSAKVVTGQFMDDTDDFFYIEEEDRSAGIRVNHTSYPPPSVGDMVNLTGRLAWTQTPEFALMEPVIIADSDSISATAGGTVPRPIGVTPKNASAKLPFLNPLGQSGIGNVGLLMTVWGSAVDALGPDSYGISWLLIDDGSGTTMWIRGPLPESDPQAYLGKTVRATGVMGVTWAMSAAPAMTLYVREESVASDFAVLTP